jgi:virginiamycin B lyase
MWFIWGPCCVVVDGPYLGPGTTGGAIIGIVSYKAGTKMDSIVAGPDGSMWLAVWVEGSGTGSGRMIGRITVGKNQRVTLFPLPATTNPNGVSGGMNVVAGPDGALWYTEENDNLIGRITTNGVVTAQYVLPTANSNPQGLVLGSDGALWFTEDGGNRIGRLTTTGSYSEFANPGGAATVTQTSPMAAGVDGALWFASAGNVVRAGFR